MRMFSVLLCASVLLCGLRSTAQLAPAPEIAATDPEEAAGADNVRALLQANKFGELDRLADSERRDGTRDRGGAWQLHELYGALDRPEKTDPDTVAHLDHLRAWMASNPQSVTARVALATSLTRWAWVARGNGFANTVTPDRWALFKQRIGEAAAVLRASEAMAPFCPQWFSAMMSVGLAEGWDRARMQAILDRGHAVAPGYFYLDQQFANYLQAKWYGQPGDAAAFATMAANRAGGDAGDGLYFRLAAELVHRGRGNTAPADMDWPRIQRGYAALAAQYGRDRRFQNELALLAALYQDRDVARQQFAVIGSHWSRRVWGDQQRFERTRDWANEHTAWPQ